MNDLNHWHSNLHDSWKWSKKPALSCTKCVHAEMVCKRDSSSCKWSKWWVWEVNENGIQTMYVAFWNNLNVDQLHLLDMGMIQFLVDFHFEDVDKSWLNIHLVLPQCGVLHYIRHCSLGEYSYDDELTWYNHIIATIHFVQIVAYTNYFYILGELGPIFQQNQNHIFQGEKMRKNA